MCGLRLMVQRVGERERDFTSSRVMSAQSTTAQETSGAGSASLASTHECKHEWWIKLNSRVYSTVTRGLGTESHLNNFTLPVPLSFSE